MKKQVVILAAALFLLSVGAVSAQSITFTQGAKLSQEAVHNYLNDLNSDNLGVRVSAAYFMGEYKVEEAVIPLMKMLNSENTEEARIIAALSLTKIGTGKAIYAVKQSAFLDDSQRVRNLCTIFYNSYAYGDKEAESRI